MLKTSRSTESTTKLEEGRVGVYNDSRARRNSKYELSNEVDNIEFDDDKIGDSQIGDNEVGKKDQKTSKSKKLSKSKKIIEFDFFTLRARLGFIKLRQAFVKVSILYHFDPERYIQVEIDILGYAIGVVFSQLISNNLGRWYPVIFFS